MKLSKRFMKELGNVFSKAMGVATREAVPITKEAAPKIAKLGKQAEFKAVFEKQRALALLMSSR